MIKAILFDFDGVIADSYSINLDICREMDKELSEERFKEHHDNNCFEKPRINMGPYGKENFIKRQRQLLNKNHLFPLKKTLTELQKNFKLLIVSSSMEENIRYLLEMDGYDRFFEQILGVNTHTSKVEKFKMIFKKYDLKPEECVFVTDTTGDIKEARNVRIESIAVSWGFHEKERLAKAKPLTIVDNQEELLIAINKLNN